MKDDTSASTGLGAATVTATVMAAAGQCRASAMFSSSAGHANSYFLGRCTRSFLGSVLSGKERRQIQDKMSSIIHFLSHLFSAVAGRTGKLSAQTELSLSQSDPNPDHNSEAAAEPRCGRQAYCLFLPLGQRDGITYASRRWQRNSKFNYLFVLCLSFRMEREQFPFSSLASCLFVSSLVVHFLTSFHSRPLFSLSLSLSLSLSAAAPSGSSSSRVLCTSKIHVTQACYTHSLAGKHTDHAR